ncbi:glutamate-1-semialdehyde 2,1-aminomutase [Paramaledivibacter caminithermalis]|jgi:glutamate-1-semialdehyde 2,1-aminomutase|uniref:Glutamate-1-semialdehyde 2,1-aminomutase n=1 Tax=Paramaledivibacter caminithermalis (strain DSM 15212 / CIP 107654 / DViRD3) TaxID=1121301 RepID=A0A1M6MKT0_PARC5|nr:glutamate-1-semialdehyde 2,1-aminomutase [Paramaledivibacter caminithermalis]SHJ84062.1 glutamate-1-semialdehyde 2,1-aminomutase [Paramaledivibacter caminithermalis DSM 15212]
MNLLKSKKAFEEAKQYIPGGVNSPVRAFNSVSVNPPFIKSGKGSKIYDIDGNEYIDYVGSWGPLILGHCHEDVMEELRKVLETGTSFGAPTERETELAKLICEIVPSVEMIRMVNSGTEATMSALRLARAYTGRDLIVKFIGNYHGHSDSLLVRAGSGALTHGVPDSPGVPADIVKNTISAKYNDIQGMKSIFENYGDRIAGVIIEPVAGNMGVVPATQEFIDFLRNITKQYGALLIFDEVMTGFRVAFNCASSLYNINPDITCFGKIIGGGLPVGAYGGRRDIMARVSPAGPVYQAGTLSGNPLAVTAGLTTLRILRDNSKIYDELEEKSRILEEGFRQNSEKIGIQTVSNRVGSMLCTYFTSEKVYDYDSAVKSDINKYNKYFEEMLKQGIYLAPSQFEASFISASHTMEDIEKTIKANYNALKKLV